MALFETGLYMQSSCGCFQSRAFCVGIGMEIFSFPFPTLPLGLMRYGFLSQLSDNSNRTTVFDSTCGFGGTDFVTWIWLLKFYVSVCIFKECIDSPCLNVAT